MLRCNRGVGNLLIQSMLLGTPSLLLSLVLVDPIMLCLDDLIRGLACAQSSNDEDLLLNLLQKGQLVREREGLQGIVHKALDISLPKR